MYVWQSLLWQPSYIGIKTLTVPISHFPPHSHRWLASTNLKRLASAHEQQQQSLWTPSSRAASALTLSRWKEPLIPQNLHMGSAHRLLYMWSSFAPSRELGFARWWPLISFAGNKLQDHLMCGHRGCDASQMWANHDTDEDVGIFCTNDRIRLELGFNV